MKCIFWNMSGFTDFAVVLDVLTQETPDLYFLAETEEELIIKNKALLINLGYEHYENPGCNRIIILKKTSLQINLGRQSTYYSTIKERQSNVFIISVHLPSQMYQSLDALKSFMRRFRAEIDSEIGDSLNENILIIGDFNVNPFEKPMIDFDGFSASNSFKLRSEAVHLSERKSLYYNPTWLLYANNIFPGTKYFKRPSTSSFDILEHHFLDQVVLSYYMSRNILSEKISILTKTKHFDFFDYAKNMTSLSDHLPIIYEYKLT